VNGGLGRKIPPGTEYVDVTNPATHRTAGGALPFSGPPPTSERKSRSKPPPMPFPAWAGRTPPGERGPNISFKLKNSPRRKIFDDLAPASITLENGQTFSRSHAAELRPRHRKRRKSRVAAFPTMMQSLQPRGRGLPAV